MLNKPDIVAIIFARGGSKGLPNKNIMRFAGKPLIAWAIEHAKSVENIRRVIVSTDSSEIATIAAQHGAEIPFIRPDYLARDDTPEWLAWRHALEYIRSEEGSLPDIMVSVPTTAPLRQPEDIRRCLALFYEGDVDVVITVTDAHRNPFFNMVTMHEDATVELVIPKSSNFTRRQDAPKVFDITTAAYVVSPNFVMTHESIFGKRVKGVYIPIERSIDIDTMLDFKYAEYIFKNSKKIEKR